MVRTSRVGGVVLSTSPTTSLSRPFHPVFTSLMTIPEEIDVPIPDDIERVRQVRKGNKVNTFCFTHVVQLAPAWFTLNHAVVQYQ